MVRWLYTHHSLYIICFYRHKNRNEIKYMNVDLNIIAITYKQQLLIHIRPRKFKLPQTYVGMQIFCYILYAYDSFIILETDAELRFRLVPKLIMSRSRKLMTPSQTMLQFLFIYVHGKKERFPKIAKFSTNIECNNVSK